MDGGAGADCFSDNTMAELVSGRLSSERLTALESHVDRCHDCRLLLARAAVSGVARGSWDGAGASPAGGTHGRERLAAESDYVIVREIARGGMGRIVEAWDTRHGRAVALKLLLRDEPAARVRFAREVRVTSRLQHPAVVPLYEAGVLPSGEPFFAMKLVSGRSLDAASNECTALPERLRLLPHLVAVIEAIAYAHDRRVVHRDLKPANVLVGAFGETVVIDWGLAKELDREAHDDDRARDGRDDERAPDGVTVAGRALGTPVYMAPEQARGEPANEHADVYALGAMLYHVLSGAPPYAGGAPQSVVARVVEGGPPPLRARAPEVPEDLAAIVDKAMARDPAGRYADARAMADDLARYLAGRVVSAHDYSFGALAARWVARHRAVVGTAGVLVAALIATATIGFRRTVRERDRANAQHALAVTQRDAAERVVEFVVGTLKDRLVPVGKLDLLAGVGSQVDRYYASLPAVDGAGQDDAIARRATALETLALVEEGKGDNAEVVELCARAREMRERRVRARPEDVDNAAISVDDESQIAAAIWRQGKHDDGIERSKGASRRARALFEASPESAVAGRVAAHTDGTLCNLLLYVPDGPAAKDACDHARDAALAVLRRSPEDTEASLRLARAYYFLGTWETHFGTRDQAAAAYRSSVSALEGLAHHDPGRADTKRLLADSLSRLGEAEIRSGHVAAAAEAYRSSLDARTALAARDPDSLDLRRELMVADNGMGAFYLATKDVPHASTFFADSLAIARSLSAARPGDSMFLDDLGYALRNEGEAMLALSDFAGARAAWSEAVETSDRGVKSSNPNRRARYTLALGLRGLSVAEEGLGHFDLARAAFERGRSTVDALLAEGDDRLYRKAAAVLDASGGELFARLGEASKAAELDRRAYAEWKSLLDANPTDVDLAASLADSAKQLAALTAPALTRAPPRRGAR